jgi:RNA polymerase sigma-70 factor, ECF subfamily
VDLLPVFVLPWGLTFHLRNEHDFKGNRQSEIHVNEQDRLDIDAAKNGNHEAYRRLVERYEADISRLMYRFSQNDLICEELVQEVFVEAYFSLDSYKFKAPFIFWLKTIASRVGYRLWKRNAKQRKHVNLDDTDEMEAPTEPGLEHDDLLNTVHRLLDQLSPVDRLVLTLMYFDKCSLREIGQRMGWSTPVVKTRAYRARKRMQAIAERDNIWEEIEWAD